MNSVRGITNLPRCDLYADYISCCETVSFTTVTIEIIVFTIYSSLYWTNFVIT